MTKDLRWTPDTEFNPGDIDLRTSRRLIGWVRCVNNKWEAHLTWNMDGISRWLLDEDNNPDKSRPRAFFDTEQEAKDWVLAVAAMEGKL